MANLCGVFHSFYGLRITSECCTSIWKSRFLAIPALLHTIPANQAWRCLSAGNTPFVTRKRPTYDPETPHLRPENGILPISGGIRAETERHANGFSRHCIRKSRRALSGENAGGFLIFFNFLLNAVCRDATSRGCNTAGCHGCCSGYLRSTSGLPSRCCSPHCRTTA